MSGRLISLPLAAKDAAGKAAVAKPTISREGTSNEHAKSKRPILLTGVNGQVGFELARSLQGLGRVVALDRSRLDLDDLDQVRRVVRDEKLSLIVNPAAYTAVDKAETDASNT